MFLSHVSAERTSCSVKHKCLVCIQKLAGINHDNMCPSSCFMHREEGGVFDLYCLTLKVCVEIQATLCNSLPSIQRKVYLKGYCAFFRLYSVPLVLPWYLYRKKALLFPTSVSETWCLSKALCSTNPLPHDRPDLGV